jgi:phosphoglucosamine mutase
MHRFPQILLSVRVGSKPDVSTVPGLAAAVRRAEEALGERGRVLVRYSGTEPLLRVMVEGEQEAQIRSFAQAIADEARRSLGGLEAAAPGA